MDKPTAMTSFRVVKEIRQCTGCKKVGHAGTLDPMATGVLLVCTGKSTKQVSSLMGMEKVYEGVIELGKVTDTDDAEGKILSESEVPYLAQTDIEVLLKNYCGEIDQVPPQFSALKKNGTRLYKLARQGIKVKLEPRKVMVYDIQLMTWQSPYIHLHVRCGKGTYIRSLARDIGANIGSGGYLKALRRIRIGPYHVDEAWQLDQFKSMIVNNENIS
ncbi:tRNA pseudouridine(55) synthase TruB [bacterium]